MTLVPLNLFWWSPRRDPGLARRELKSNSTTWLRMGLHGGRYLTNFGDELSPLVLRYVTGRTIRWSPPNKAEIVSIGSILEYVDRRTDSQPWIWGTGLRQDPAGRTPKIIVGSERVLAVRGPLSRRALGLERETAIGDPGVFASELGKFAGLRRSGTLFIPHFRTWATPSGRKFLERAGALGYTVANPSLAPLEMMQMIARADFVLSSSLHGVVVAHALGVPVQLVSIPSSGRNEPSFKYEDYFESIGVEYTSVELDAALTANQRNPLLEARDGDVLVARQNCSRLAEQLTRAIERIR